MTASDIFKRYAQRCEARGSAAQGAVLFLVDNTPFLLTPQTRPYVQPRHVGAPCTVRFSEAELRGIVSGEENPQELYLSGRLAIKGEAAHALWLNPLFSELADLP